MKGKLIKIDEMWMVGTVCYADLWSNYIPLHPDDVKEINELSKIFDNVDARYNGQEVEFEMTYHWDETIPQPISVGRLIKTKEDDKDGLYDTVNDVEKLAANLANPNVDKTDNWIEGYLYAKETLYTEELKKVYELAEESWEGCDGCDENDKNFFINGFRAGYNTAKPDGIPRLMYKDGREIRSYHSPILDELLKEISDEEALRLAKKMNKQPLTFVPSEISDEEIEKEASKIHGVGYYAFSEGAKWYREQLKQNK